MLSVGWTFLQQRPTEYRAATTLVVLPDNANAEAASYYDTLSQGQIATTFAQILDLQATPPAPAAGSDPATISVDVLPDTSLIQVTATAAEPAAAEAAADATLVQVQPYFDQLGWPYDVSVVEPAAGTAERAGFTSSVLLSALAVVALVAAIAAYLAVRTLQQTRAGRPAAVPADETGGQRRVADRSAVPSGTPVADQAEPAAALADPPARPAGAVEPADAPRSTPPATAPIEGAQVSRRTTAPIVSSAATAPDGSHPAADPQPTR